MGSYFWEKFHFRCFAGFWIWQNVDQKEMIVRFSCPTKPFTRQPHKIFKHTQTVCLSVFDHFVGLTCEGLIMA